VGLRPIAHHAGAGQPATLRAAPGWRAGGTPTVPLPPSRPGSPCPAEAAAPPGGRMVAGGRCGGAQSVRGVRYWGRGLDGM